MEMRTQRNARIDRICMKMNVSASAVLTNTKIRDGSLVSFVPASPPFFIPSHPRDPHNSPRLPRAREMRTRMNDDKAEYTYVTYLSGVSGSIQTLRRRTEIYRTAVTSRSYADSCFAPGKSPPPWRSIWKYEST